MVCYGRRDWIWTQLRGTGGDRNESILCSETLDGGRSVLVHTRKLSELERKSSTRQAGRQKAKTLTETPSHLSATRRYFDRLGRFGNRTGLDDRICVRYGSGLL